MKLAENDKLRCVVVYKQRGETNDVDHDDLKIKKKSVWSRKKGVIRGEL